MSERDTAMDQSPSGVPVLLFAKQPIAGLVKTRLAASLGEEVAVQLARAFLRDSVCRFARWPGGELWLLGDSPSVGPFRDYLVPGVRYAWQGEGDLGARQARALEACFAAGCPAAIVVGADTPHLPLAFLQVASTVVKERRGLLVPSEDGGYVLLALPGTDQDLSALLTGISWGQRTVFRELAARMSSVQIPFRTLPAQLDLDEEADLEQLWGHLSGVPAGHWPHRTAWHLARLAEQRGWS